MENKISNKNSTVDTSLSFVFSDKTAEEKDKVLLNAFLKKDIEAVKALLKSENGVRGANPNMRDEFGRTLYHLAHRWGWSDMKGVLHQHGGRLLSHTNVSSKTLNRSRSR